MEDQRPKTQEHIDEVRKLLQTVMTKLLDRSMNHDQSKLESPEREIFDEYTPRLRDTTYGSDKYNGYLKEMKVALDHHYKQNRHHPEHHENGVKDMNLIDLIEMLCDWKAATMRHADGDIMKSIEHNQKRFGYSNELASIFKNTIRDLGWE
jgi:hypothetical protein